MNQVPLGIEVLERDAVRPNESVDAAVWSWQNRLVSACLFLSLPQENDDLVLEFFPKKGEQETFVSFLYLNRETVLGKIAEVHCR